MWFFFYFFLYSFSFEGEARDIVELCVKPFEMCLTHEDISSVMCSYNNINSVPACIGARLLKGTISEMESS